VPVFFIVPRRNSTFVGSAQQQKSFFILLVSRMNRISFFELIDSFVRLQIHSFNHNSNIADADVNFINILYPQDPRAITP
ncbi:MAG: hypothetical protein ACI8RD_007209, partial [Bacillariaceae sp.]|jgi:hypothetical protein